MQKVYEKRSKKRILYVQTFVLFSLLSKACTLYSVGLHASYVHCDTGQ